MQVKKFEARTMKEALELVKNQLGPDAIILNARDLRKGYGLVGQNSVEITAAVSEDSLRKLKFAESRMHNRDREKAAKSSVGTQKKVIEKFVSRYVEDSQPTADTSARRYIDIPDEPEMSLESFSQMAAQKPVAEARIKSAAQRAWAALQPTQPKPSISKTAVGNGQNANANEQSFFELGKKEQELLQLKNELQEMKKMIGEFQKVPQTLVNSYPGAKFGLPYEASPIFERLLNTGMKEDFVGSILVEALQKLPTSKFKNKNMIEGWVAKNILEKTITAPLSASGVHIFVGPSGSGKTSSLVKLAARYVIEQKKRVALVTCDLQKVGAAEQMKIYAQILNVPFAVLRSPQEWALLKQRLSNVDVVLVDFPSWSLKSINEITQAKQWMSCFGIGKSIHLTLSSLGKTEDLLEIGKRFSVLPISDCLFSAIDEAAEFGNIYQFSQTHKLPIFAFGTGTKVPEDFEIATKERMLDLLFKMTQMRKNEVA